jgi:hypothetical protein
MADCCFPAERRSVDAGMTSQLARLHVVPLRPGKGAADRRRSPRPFSEGNSRPECTLLQPDRCSDLASTRSGTCALSAPSREDVTTNEMLVASSTQGPQGALRADM